MTLGSIGFAYIVQGTVQGYGSVGIIGEVALKIAESPRYIRTAISQLLSQNANLVKLPEELGANINTYFNESRRLGLISFFEPRENGNGTFLLKDIETGALVKKWSKVAQEPQTISFFDNTLIIGGEKGDQDSTDSLSKINSDGRVLWKAEINSHKIV